jgi:transcription antitermination factor NusG
METTVTEMAKLYPELSAGTSASASSGIAAATALAPEAVTRVPRWYVVCTRSRHERVTHEQLHSRGIEAYLPLCESLRQWHDRRKKLMLPAFPGYLFARFPFSERVRVLSSPGVTRLVMFGQRAASLPDEELEQLRTALSIRSSEPHPYLPAGARVRIVSGPLRGLSDVVQREHGLRMIISVDCVCRSIAVELHESDLQLE